MKTTAMAAVYNQGTEKLDILKVNHGAADDIFSSLNAAYTST